MMSPETIAKNLNLVRAGRTFTGACPSCGYASGFSVEEKNHRILVCCHAGGCSQGDVISALRSLGLWTGENDDEWRPPPSRQTRKPADDIAAKIARAQAIWHKTDPAPGTLVETYLRARGINLPVPPTLRYAAALRHTETGLDLPVMVGAVTVWPSKTPTAIHRTYLALNGMKKANVTIAKKSLAPMAGGAVRLAAAGPVLIVGEGIESTLSAMQASGLPGWAALSTAGMRALILPDIVREVIIAADHDSNGAGQAAAHAAAEHWHAEGRKVRIALPPIPGTDFNDLIRAETTQGVNDAR